MASKKSGGERERWEKVQEITLNSFIVLRKYILRLINQDTKVTILKIP